MDISESDRYTLQLVGCSAWFCEKILFGYQGDAILSRIETACNTMFVGRSLGMRNCTIVCGPAVTGGHVEVMCPRTRGGSLGDH